jgi:hypothetical protein
LYRADLAALGYSTIHESFENGTVWADSRNTISNPGSTPVVISQGIVWTSNYLQNKIATGTVGGSAPDGAFAIYSLPHGMTTDSGLYCDSAEDPCIPTECYQNDGLKVESETGDTLYAFGGRIDTASSGKVTFLLDGFDINGNGTDNIDNWQREGDAADNWAFVGVIDTDGFLSAELRELRGKDSNQVLLFCDSFTIVSPPVCIVNLEHFSMFAMHWLDTPCGAGNNWCQGADLDLSTSVEINDIGELAFYWLNDCPLDWPWQ